MSNPFKNLPPEQEAIRAKCFHPSATFVEFPCEDVETSIPARFEKIVRTYPDRLAIKDNVNYAKLNAVANPIARAVLAQGNNNQEPVALLFNKGIEQIAAVLGVLKAGRTFVLMDASLPPSRLDLILEDCSPGITLTDRQNSLLASQLSHRKRPVIGIESVAADPGNVRPNLDIPYAPPATAIEAQLASIWAEVLSLDQVGVHDDFFDLAGHSLATSRVISRVIQTFQLELPLGATVRVADGSPNGAGCRTAPTQTDHTEELEQLLAEIEAMSKEEARRLLAGRES